MLKSKTAHYKILAANAKERKYRYAAREDVEMERDAERLSILHLRLIER